jgi:shikimate 5-dehydrogenase
VLDRLQPRVVVQATPVGGVTAPDQRLVPEWRAHPGCTVLDMVYRPRRTRFLADAEAQGATTVDGLALFLAQAAEQFAIFTGCEIGRAELASFLAGT